MKNMKNLFFAAALGLAGMTFASANTYNMVLSTAAKAGDTQLAPGAYKVDVNPRFATFVNLTTNKSVMVLYRLDSTGATYDRTAVELKNHEGTERIESIELENSGNKLEF